MLLLLIKEVFPLEVKYRAKSKNSKIDFFFSFQKRVDFSNTLLSRGVMTMSVTVS